MPAVSEGRGIIEETEWKGNNANSFFGLFGDAFRDSAVQNVKKKPGFAEAIKEFLDLGDTPNDLTHLNFAGFALDMTAEEVYKNYQTAATFIAYLESKPGSFGKLGEQWVGGGALTARPSP